MSTALSGTSMIGFGRGRQGGARFRATDPSTGEPVGPDYQSAGLEDLERAAGLARAAATGLASLPGARKAAFLDQIAVNIEALGPTLWDCVMRETGLPASRVQGETARTCIQLRLFASIAAEGSWVDARIDATEPGRKPDIRSMLRPLGPAAVFGAGNFPLAFSVAGGDTASAFAAGCPVIVKAHPAHPGTSELVGDAIVAAVKACGLPEGTFSLIYDSGIEIAIALVKRPEIKAVGFTGSRRGGQALIDAAASRPDRIPVYAEMSSVNPFFFMPGAFGDGWEQRVDGLVASLTGSAGQFCTKPGLIFLRESSDAEAFVARLHKQLAGQSSFTMLTGQIRHAFEARVADCRAQAGVATLLRAEGGADAAAVTGAALFRTRAREYLSNPRLHEELFGPAAVVITYQGRDELLEIARSLEGQLTATIHGTEEEFAEHAELIAALETKAGRLVCNGFPTGVEVCHAMVHGGPWPATSDSRSTSVGGRALERFARLVCYQSFPQSRLPDELKDTNPLGIWRMVNGLLSRDPFTVTQAFR
ncbi:MAG: aldehyde dehydrogenase (NADP(+)) [Candidatus Eremiobacteraeota bacterium]|nr:aldehyde dehydrogenase (NADP(+)) [Candidatus Eremiobacteraeota bacterium]